MTPPAPGLATADAEADPLAFLAGGGEMGALIRAHDWSRTPLGPPDTWPLSLRTAVGILLASGYPMYIAWGPHFTQLYNDAYRPILGTTKHPAALGESTRRTFAEIWDFIGPMFEGVMATGTASTFTDQLLALHRYGYVEECYFTFSYSAIRTETGGVGGVFVTVLETTERVLRERRERTVLDVRAVPGRGSVDEICTAAAAVLAANPHDLPFALFCRPGDGGPVAVASCGLRDEAAGLVAELWTALAAGGPVGVRTVALPAPRPFLPWPEPVGTAVVLPIVPIGRSVPVAYFVAGLSARLRLDADYEKFLEAIAAAIAGAIAEAEAFEAERRRAEALAELDRAKTTFFSNVSHEFRTPLTLMLGPLQDLLDEPAALPARARDRLQMVQRNATRLLKLVNTLLDFARIEAGRVEAVYEPIDLAACTAELAGVFRSAIERAGLELRVDCPPLPEPVHVDREMWEKIVLNLVSNAFKFTLSGRITVALRAAGARAELVVEDTGTGIPEAELPRVFERFHRVQDARGRTHEGTGIGLALVKELVALHGGEIAVDSRVGRGTRFVVAIPFGTAHLPAGRLGAARTLASTAVRALAYVEESLRWLPGDALGDPAEDRPPGPDTGGARILLADDNADMRDYLRRLLGDRWQVEAVSDGAQALEVVRDRRVDVVVTDVMMPNLDGFGLLRELRADPATRGIPVIMLSARAGEESRIEGLSAGADDYLIKPFSARELVARVETQLVRGRLRVAEESLQRRLAEVFRHVPVGIALLRGPEHVFEFANDDCLALVSHRPLVGRTVREALPELEDQGFAALLDQVYRSGEPYIGRSVRVALRGSDGAPGERFVDFVYQPMPGADGRTEGIAVVAFDVTELASARQEAEAASRAKDEFLAMLGHELRNPLAPIMTALHLIHLRHPGVAETELAVIERQIRHMTRLVDDLLDVSRIARGLIELRRERLEAAEVVAKAIETASPLLERRLHNLSVDVPASGLVIDGDRVRLAQVLANLLTNAAKYTEPGGHIHVEGRREGDEVVIRVRDDGIGISPEMLPRVFDLFVQEPRAPARAPGGLGLGLTISRSLVALHGGALVAESEGLGRGSTFVVGLPAARAPQPERQPAPPAPPAARSGGRPGHRVLVVDDNEDAAIMLSLALSAAGHETRVAHDGPGALALALEFRPDVAVLDLGLPVMDGFELGRRLRTIPALERLVLVAVTGYGQAADRARSAAAGFDAHLVKPIDLTALDRLIGDLTARAAAGKRDREGSTA